MNPLDLAYINRLAPYKVWTETPTATVMPM